MTARDSHATAFAAYDEDAHELRLYKRGTMPKQGEYWEGMHVASVWPGLEDKEPNRTKPFIWLSDVTAVTCMDKGIRPVNMRSWFAGMANLTLVDLDKLDMSHVRDVRHLFDGCASLRLDCTGWTIPADAEHDGFSDDAPRITPPNGWPACPQPERERSTNARPGRRSKLDAETIGVWLEWADKQKRQGGRISGQQAYHDGLTPSLSTASRHLKRLRETYPDRFPTKA